MSKRKATPLVEVTWEDACNSARWLRPEEVDVYIEEPFLARTSGYLMRDTTACVIVAASLNSEDWAGGVWRIPRGMVRKVRRLR